jgi:uncharacterized protein YndB with AHSA1/START domain
MAEHPRRDAEFRIVIQADIQRVWHELTKAGEAQGAVFNAWLHSTGMDAGHRMQMRTGSGKHVIVDGEVVGWNPPRRFAHTHRFAQHDDPVCQVVYELQEVDGGVQVTLRVLGLPVGTPTAKGMDSGGHTILRCLKAVVETGQVPVGTRVMYWMFDKLKFMLPARTKSEHWPLASGKTAPWP